MVNILSFAQHASFEKALYISALAPTAAIIGYGAYALSTGADGLAAADQAAYDKQYVLVYADGHEAVFKADAERYLVTVGSSLSSAGHVVSIEKHDDRWVVTTSKHIRFVSDAVF